MDSIDALRRADVAALVDRFTAVAEHAGSKVHRLAGWMEVASLALDLAGPERVVVTGDLVAAQRGFVEALGDHVVEPAPNDPRFAADAAVGVVRCRLAVAETGSVLVSEHPLGDRAVSMLSRAVVQVIAADHVVASLDDVAAWLLERRVPGYHALVTGPSRTADIERSLTIGVQGPRESHVVVLS